MVCPLLEIKNLSVDFITDAGKFEAVKNISFAVHKGETIAIVGESGSGKTVTSLSILQLLPVPPARYRTGKILYSEKENEPADILQFNKKELQQLRGNQISMIFQEPMTSLNPVQTCGSQVIEALQLHKNLTVKEAREVTVDLFDKVKLPHPSSILHRYPHQLSGGQKQRVMIAMAVSCNPSLLIADEPTTALDVTVQKAILQLLKELQQQQHMSIMYITHDLGLVAEIADSVIVMYKGEIVEMNPTREIFTHPQHPYTRALISCRPSPALKRKRLPVISDYMQGNLETNHGEIFFNQKDDKAAADKKDVLKVESLKVYFPLKRSITGKILNEFRAVDDVSFSVKQGEVVGLVGESGCGKTTLGRTLLRLIEPTSGNIFLNNKNIAHIPEDKLRKMRKNIQIIFQDPYGSLNPRITIGDAINEPMKVHNILPSEKMRKEKIMELLEKVDLKPEHFNRYPHEFSGGQRQRICIARALSLDPEFIICDESVSALDVSVQAQVLNLLNDLRQELGFTCIFISHDLGVVHYISDRIMVMQAGKIAEEGSADDIYFRPKNSYTQQLIAAVPKINF
ncbi:MAG TPA: ABC transporter ATP-binding protein [Chitinophagaceae bacterium]|nr:ABC transporter ATP-binding protein [Chitinophagaceae bacterium]